MTEQKHRVGELAHALAEQRHGSERIGETLIRLGLIERHELAAVLADQYIRRFVGALGITALAFQPGIAAAGTVRSQMAVSATIAGTATSDVRLIGAGAPGGAGASVSVQCNVTGTARIGIEHGRLEAPAAGAANAIAANSFAPSYVVTWRSNASAAVNCGAAPQSVVAPFELAADHDAGSASGLPAVSVVIAY